MKKCIKVVLYQFDVELFFFLHLIYEKWKYEETVRRLNLCHKCEDIIHHIAV